MSHYLQMLVWTMFFVVLVEMTFPDSDIKKYLKFVLSFLVLYVVVSPLVEPVISTQYMPGNALENYIQYYQEYVGDEISYSPIEDERQRQEKGLLELYTVQLQQHATQLLQTQLPDLEIKRLEIETEMGAEGIGIEAIEVNGIYTSQEAAFEVGIGNKNESPVIGDEWLKKEIEKCLNDFYNLDNTNIYITVQMN